MTFCKYLDKFMSGIVTYFSNINTLGELNLFSINKSSISLGINKEDELFGCKLVGKSNRVLGLGSVKDIASTVQYATGQSEIYIYYVKKDNHQATYIFSYSEDAINQVCHDLGILRLSGRSLVVSIFDIYHIGDYFVDETNRLKYSESPKKDEDYFIPWDFEVVSEKFKGMITNSVGDLLSSGTLYQAVIAQNKTNFNIVDLYKSDWEGTLSMRVDFSYTAVASRLRKYESVARFGDGNFYSVLQSVISNVENQDTKELITEHSCILNMQAMLLGKDSDIALKKISNIVGLQFMPNHLSSGPLLRKSMLLARDASFDMIIPTEHMAQFISTSHKKPTIPKNFVYWYGQDISNNYIDYSLDDNKSPHVIYTGATGAGKSRQAIKGLEQILGYDKKTKQALRFEDFNVRYCDVGYTAGNLAMGLRNTYGDKVKIYPSKVSKLKFSLFDISKNSNGQVEDDDIKFMSHLVNFALDIQANGKTSLTSGALNGGEMYFLQLIVRDMIENDEYLDRFLSAYKIEGGYEEMLERLYSKGYTEDTRVSALPDEYAFLKKPTLPEVASKINVWTKKDTFSELEKEELKRLEQKLGGLKSLTFLKMHSNHLKTYESFTHIDFDEIKDSPVDFAIIYWMLVKDWIEIMKDAAKKSFSKGIVTNLKKTLFYVDEAHNFFVYKSFEGLLIRSVKEFRKYGGIFFFLSQELDDAPKKVISQMGTKIFVVPPESKEELGKIIEQYFGKLKDEDKLVLDEITDYMMYIMSDNGSLGLKYEPEPDEEAFYKPNHPDFKKL